MKKLFVLAFAIIALVSCAGNGCSRLGDSTDSTRVDSTIVIDSVNQDSINILDSASVDLSMVCPN